MDNSLGGLGTQLNFSTSCHPQIDGQTKVVNKSLSTMLRVILKDNKKSWNEYISYIMLGYNRVVPKTTRILAFEVTYGFNPFHLWT